MFELPRVIEVRHVRDHVLWLRFNDGLEGEVDLSAGLRGPIFDPLRDPVFFARVRVEQDSIAWPNGADWSPQSLHEMVAARVRADRQPNDGAAIVAKHDRGSVPEISRFFGIVITMYFDDHARPHFHARYGEHLIAVEIDGDGVSGSFPPHRLHLLFDWRDAHRAELREYWGRLREGRAPNPIPPLD